jgi:hypothetical protein
MATIMCGCNANDAVIAGRCLPCHKDHVDAQRAEQQAQERARIEARRRGRPIWKPDHGERGHGLGRGRHCGE